MIPEIEALFELQLVEHEISEKREELERLKPRAIAVQKRQKDGTERLTREQEELTQLRKTLDLNRLEIERLEGVVKHYEDQQSLIRTTKEMAALNHELDLSRTQKQKCETEQAAMQQRREEIERDLAELEGSVEKLRERCEEEIADIKGEAEEIKTRIKELKARQAEMRGKIPGELLEEYDDLNKKYPGSAMTDAQGGSCLGCNMELIPQIKIELRLGRGILRCHRCGRLLRRDLDFSPAEGNQNVGS